MVEEGSMDTVESRRSVKTRCRQWMPRAKKHPLEIDSRGGRWWMGGGEVSRAVESYPHINACGTRASEWDLLTLTGTWRSDGGVYGCSYKRRSLGVRWNDACRVGFLEVNRSGFEKTKSKNIKNNVDLMLRTARGGGDGMICSEGGNDGVVKIG